MQALSRNNRALRNPIQPPGFCLGHSQLCPWTTTYMSQNFQGMFLPLKIKRTLTHSTAKVHPIKLHLMLKKICIFLYLAAKKNA